MATNLRRAIFGIPRDDHSTAGTNATAAHQASEQPRYLPASQLTEQQIEGVGLAGDCWVPWRVDGSGEQWFRRVSDDTATQPVAIMGIAAEPSEDEDEPDTDDTMSAFRREVAIPQSQHERGEISGDEDSGDDLEPDTIPTHAHLEQLAESLIRQPVYVLLSGDGANFGSEFVAGTYAPRLDLIAKDFLVTAGRWEGRRPAVFIDDSYCSPMQVHATLLHELSHVVDVGFSGQPEEEICEEAMNLTRLTYANGVATPIESVDFDERHSARFIRGCLHLWHRFVTAGYWCPPDWLWEGSAYGAPEPHEAIMALSGEPKRLMPLFVSTILIMPAPAAFDELFTR